MAQTNNSVCRYKRLNKVNIYHWRVLDVCFKHQLFTQDRFLFIIILQKNTFSPYSTVFQSQHQKQNPSYISVKKVLLSA